jgi:hypothetical protein
MAYGLHLRVFVRKFRLLVNFAEFCQEMGNLPNGVAKKVDRDFRAIAGNTRDAGTNI